MIPVLFSIDAKIARSHTHIHSLQREINAFAALKPYTVRVQEDVQDGARVGRLVAVKNQNVQNPDIAKVCFTGSVGGGKKIMEMASASLTRVTLELGVGVGVGVEPPSSPPLQPATTRTTAVLAIRMERRIILRLL